MQGYTNLANIAVISPMSTMETPKAHSHYSGYPNPKKARLIQQVVLSKSVDESRNDLNGLDILPKIQAHISHSHSSYPPFMAGATAPYFYSPTLLEPYMIGPEFLSHRGAQTFDLPHLPASTKAYCSFSPASILLAGTGIEWSAQGLPTYLSSGGGLKSETGKQFSIIDPRYSGSYGDCSEMASSLLNNLKSRDALLAAQHDCGRYHDQTSYNGYEQPSTTAWYKLKEEESHPACPTVPGLAVEQLATGYDYNYREMKEKRKCDVCGDVSAGFHCSAFVCEACKKFFIRSSKGDNYTKYSCTKTNNCEVVKDTRTHCQFCRFQKCINLGMTFPGANLNQNTDISLIPCRVCGAQSSGFHFGAITCEGCKGFFRRTINERENQKYSCRNGGNCVINLATRNNCKSCRYKKCILVGMSKEGSRIGRQPNAIKHMCAKEINQIRTGIALNHFTNNSMNSDPCSLQSYLPNQLSSVLISSMNLDFNQSRYQQSSVPSSSSEFYVNIAPPMYSVQGQDALRECKAEQESSNLPYLQVSRGAMKLETSTNNYHSAFSYDTNDDKSDEIDLRYISDIESSFAQDQSFLTSIDRYPSSSIESKFSVDMPLQTFLTDVNLSAKSLYNCRQRLVKQFQLSMDADEITVWDVMMQHFQVHAIQVIKFAKGVPGFKELCHNDMKVLVQESMYPIILVQLARDFNLVTEEYNYFNFSNDEKEIILTKFSIFNKIAEQVLHSGRLIRPKHLDETLFSLICYIELVKGDSYSIFERNKVSLMYQYSVNALRLYMAGIGSSQNEIDGVLEILPVLSKMTHEHQEAVMMLRTTKPHLKFPNLYTQMFLVD